MKFVVDGMLGKLARCLRMMGHNVKYSTTIDDSQLLVLAKNEHRVLLTRDFELFQRAIAKRFNACYFESSARAEEERLAELARRYDIKLEIDMTISRCPKCNVTVKQIPKKNAKGRVEGGTFRHCSEFWECPRCHQVYWQGAHWTSIRKTLKAAKNHLESAEKKEV